MINLFKELTQEYLKTILHYCPNSGIFTWKKRIGMRISVGDIAASETDKGYLKIHIKNKSYFLHRVAFLYMEGSFPKNQVDHINHVPDDNRWVNLRKCTHAENARNQLIPKNNTSGYKGVCQVLDRESWKVNICFKGKQHYLGVFNNKMDAAEAYNKKAIEFHGEFAHLNEINKRD